MSRLQDLIFAIVPEPRAADMEAESRRWIACHPFGLKAWHATIRRPEAVMERQATVVDRSHGSLSAFPLRLSEESGSYSETSPTIPQ